MQGGEAAAISEIVVFCWAWRPLLSAHLCQLEGLYPGCGSSWLAGTFHSRVNTFFLVSSIKTLLQASLLVCFSVESTHL